MTEKDSLLITSSQVLTPAVRLTQTRIHTASHSYYTEIIRVVKRVNCWLFGGYEVYGIHVGDQSQEQAVDVFLVP